MRFRQSQYEQVANTASSKKIAEVEEVTDVMQSSNKIQPATVAVFSVATIIAVVVLLLAVGFLQKVAFTLYASPKTPKFLKSLLLKVSKIPSLFRSASDVDAVYVDTYGGVHFVKDDVDMLSHLIKDQHEDMEVFIEGKSPRELVDYDISRSGLSFRVAGETAEFYVLEPDNDVVEKYDIVDLYKLGRSQAFKIFWVEDDVIHHGTCRFVARQGAAIVLNGNK